MKTKRYHMIIDANNCNNNKLSDKIFLKNLIKDIADILGMKIIMGPNIAKGMPENPGYSVIAVIDYSHISIHTFTNFNEFCLDVFSCKRYNYKKLESFIKKTFELNIDNMIVKIIS